jgi:hypothetical protein
MIFAILIITKYRKMTKTMIHFVCLIENKASFIASIYSLFSMKIKNRKLSQQLKFFLEHKILM